MDWHWMSWNENMTEQKKKKTLFKNVHKFCWKTNFKHFIFIRSIKFNRVEKLSRSTWISCYYIVCTKQKFLLQLDFAFIKNPKRAGLRVHGWNLKNIYIHRFNQSHVKKIELPYELKRLRPSEWAVQLDFWEENHKQTCS